SFGPGQNYLYAMGGNDAKVHVTYGWEDATEVYSVATNSWQRVAGLRLREARAHQGPAAWLDAGRTILVAGGHGPNRGGVSKGRESTTQRLVPSDGLVVNRQMGT